MQARKGHWFNMLRAVLMLGCLTVASLASAQGLFDQENTFLSPEEAFQPTLSRNGDGLTVDWRIAPGYYLYRHRFAAEADGRRLALTLPDGETIEDEYFGRSEVYRDTLHMTLEPGNAETLTLHWQGCADAGLCYPPQQRTFALNDLDTASGITASSVPASTTSTVSTTASSEAGYPEAGSPSPAATNDSPGAQDQQLAARLAGGDAVWTLLAFFGMGLLLAFTPCMLPMIPILSSLTVGQQPQGGHRRATGFLLSTAFVLPMAATYALLGVSAAMAGANLQILLQNAWFIGLFSALFVVLALAMFGLFELELPRLLRQRLDAALSRQRGGRFKGAAAMGVLSALLVGPCSTAPLAGALLFIAESGNPWLGGAALLALGLGMGAPLVLIGTLGSRLLPRPGPWMSRVRGLFGFVLLGTAIGFLDRLLADAIVMGLWGALGLGLAVALYHLARGESGDRTLGQLAQAGAGVVGLWSTLVLVGAAGGAEDPWRPLAVYVPTGAAASASDPPLSFDNVDTFDALKSRLATPADKGTLTLVEFTAEWCVSCDVIEEEVFGNPEVKAALQDVQRLRIDVTDNDATDQALMQRFGIFGPPALMWFGPDGHELRSARIIGELGASDFLDRYAQARQAARNGGSTTP
ncbi:MAG: thiol:disulfide interchange protein DsbD [Halomonadaceae bacterium T82-2]|nr:MAG: thiol:disulfide interchange protein DsbD [Halomonadaceae bacterium T82-2]